MEQYYKLCYVEGNKAWFTNNFEKQWGDDWNDSPYECNAGYPYDSWSELIEDNEDILKKKWKSHTKSEQTVKNALNLELFFIYILNYPRELGKITVLTKF